MHYSTALFHSAESDPQDLMYPYSYDTTDPELLVFEMDYDKDAAEELFKEHNDRKATPTYKNVVDYMADYCGCSKQDEDGNFGHMNNPNGLYDWFEVGGRWEKILYPKLTKVVMKKRQDSELKNKSKYELKEYVSLKTMSPEEYCLNANSFGHTSMPLKKLDIETTLKMNSKWAGSKEIEGMFHTVICEERGLMDTDDFYDLVKEWKKKGGWLTVIDYHS